MEALFILLADLIILPLMLFATVIAQAAVALASAVASVLETIFGITLRFNWRRAKTPVSPEALEANRQRAVRRLRFMKRLALALGGVFVVLLIFVCLLNFVFFESAIRWGLGRIEKRSGVEVGFESATGSLFSGELRLKRATARRQGNNTSNFDLRAEEFFLDLAMTKLLSQSARMEKVLLSGLEGDFHRVTVPDRVKLRKQYEIAHLRLEDVEIAVRDSSREEEARFTLKIAELDGQPLRSGFAVFDLLFRSNARGEIAGCPFLIQSREAGQGRETFWQAEGLPVAFVGRYLGGPFDWLEGGTIDVRVEDKWELNDRVAIDLRWSFLMHNLVVATPDGASAANRLISATIAEYLRQNAETLNVTFSLTLNENQFEGAASAGAAGFGDATRDGFARELARLSGVSPERANEAIQRGVDFFKRHLDNRRESP